MKHALLFILCASIGIAHGQSPFEIEVLSKKYKLMEVRYDGSLGSVAGSDTTTLKSFKFSSIGTLKEASAIASGSIYSVFSYPKNQKIVIVSSDWNCCNPLDWKPIENTEFSSLNFILSSPLEDSSRNSIYIELENCKVYLLNIKDEEIALFKWMVSTIEFD